MQVVFACITLNDSYALLKNDYSKAAIAVNATNGDVSFAHNADLKLNHAPFHLMLIYLVFKNVINGNIDLDEEVILTNYTGMQLMHSLRKKHIINDILTINDLIYLVLENHHNSALMLAQHLFGNIANAVDIMNNQSQVMKLNNTLFFYTNDNYDSTRSYSTARDIIKLTIRLCYDMPSYVNFFKPNTNYVLSNGTINRIQHALSEVRGISGIYFDDSIGIAWGHYMNSNAFAIIIGDDVSQDNDNMTRKLIQLIGTVNKNDFTTKERMSVQNSSIPELFTFLSDLRLLELYNTYEIKQLQPKWRRTQQSFENDDILMKDSNAQPSGQVMEKMTNNSNSRFWFQKN